MDRLMDLSKRFPRLGFYFKSLIDDAPLSTNPIEAVFRQVRRQEIMSLFSVFPLAKALPAFNDAPCEPNYTVLRICPQYFRADLFVSSIFQGVISTRGRCVLMVEKVSRFPVKFKCS